MLFPTCSSSYSERLLHLSVEVVGGHQPSRDLVMVIGGLEGWVESEHTGLLAEAQHSLLLLLLGLVGGLSCHLTLGQHQQETW